MLHGRGWVTGERLTRAEWLPPLLGAATLWLAVWVVCTPERAAALLTGEGRPARGAAHLGSWLAAWSHRGFEAGELEWLADEHLGAARVTAQVLLTVVLFAAGAAAVLRALPPVGSRTPLTVLGCWWTAVAAAVAGSGAVALVGAEPYGSRGLTVFWTTGHGLPVLVVLALPAALVVTGSAVLLRTVALRGGHAGRPEPGPAPVGPRAQRWAAGGAALLVALLIGALGGTAMDSWFRHSGSDDIPGGPAVARWLVPNAWNLESGAGTPDPVLSLLAALPALLHVLFFGLLFWLVVRALRSRSLPASLLAGAWTGLAAGTLGRAVWVLALGGPRDFGDPGYLTRLAEWSVAYAAGALTAGVLGGLVAWTVLRFAPPGEAPAPSPAGSDGEPVAGPGHRPEDDELVVDLSR
ncbi:hypothetical protein [Streptomyces otsuchiensis]|uniref:hypothetical protein n=1 Tax=Streptomyces otsuchiensis TaxID=2681388 RepID=UPI00102F7406|nr:hypothetical protein [Streptomyces otsuchiensis]